VTGIAALASATLGVAFRPQTAGLYRRVYSGYWDGSVNFFNTATLTSQVADPSPIDLSFSAFLGNRSASWLGYFKVDTTGSYNLRVVANDAVGIWVGSTAVSGFTSGNAVLYDNQVIDPRTVTGSNMSLVGGVYYPLRIYWGLESLGNQFDGSFDLLYNPGGAFTTDLAGEIFYDITSNGI